MRRSDFLKFLAAIPCFGQDFPASERIDYGKFRGSVCGYSGPPVLVKILGTAQDGGIPQIGCRCPNCTRARRDPAEARLISSLGVADLENEKLYLIDATPDIRLQIERALEVFEPPCPALEDVLAGVVLTHAHIGHYTGLMFFGYESLAVKGLPVFCSSRMETFLRMNGPWSQLVKLGNVELKILIPDRELVLGAGIAITSANVPHRDEYADTLGLFIRGPNKRLLYIPDIQDWDSWERSLPKELGTVDFALLDGTFYGPEELPGRDISSIGHPPIKTTLDLLKNLPGGKKSAVFFTHLNHSNLGLEPAGKARREMEAAGFNLASENQVFLL